MKYKIYSNSENAWDGMLEAIKSATESIYLEMYIFLDDTSAHHNFFQALKDKAKDGIRVRIVLDTFGCFGLKSSSIRDLKKAGIEVLFFSHWLRRVHRKILIVDEKIAFLGGVNISQSCKKRNDLQIRIQKSKIVQTIIKSFAYTYKTAGGNDKIILNYLNKNFFQKARVWFLEHWPTKKTNILRKYYKERIDQAKEKIVIVTPYFIPHRWLIRALEEARQRNIKIDVILPEKTGQFMGDDANYLYASMLQPLGIDFFLTKQSHHAKALIIDDIEGCIGSHNIDALSFDFNIEAGIFFTNKKLIRDLIKIINSWKKESIIFSDIKYKPKLFDKIIAIIIKFMQPVL